MPDILKQLPLALSQGSEGEFCYDRHRPFFTLKCRNLQRLVRLMTENMALDSERALLRGISHS